MATVATEERPVGLFTGVSLDGIGTLNIVAGDAHRLTVQAEPDALPLITTIVDGATLKIHTKLITSKFFALKKPPVYTVLLPELREVALAGAGKAVVGGGMSSDLMVSMDGAGEIQLLEQSLSRLRMKIAGAGNIRGNGKATIQDLEIFGTGNYSGQDIEGEAVTVNIAGAGRAKVNATRVLHIEIGGVGSVSYLGNPQVTQNIGGLGRVTRA